MEGVWEDEANMQNLPWYTFQTGWGTKYENTCMHYVSALKNKPWLVQ